VRAALDSPWYIPGEIGWVLRDVRTLPEPVPCRGALSLWKTGPRLQSNRAGGSD
jgi:hypothetical protein